MRHKEVDYKIVVGKQVKKLRQKAGMTQDVLSERCGIYRTYLSRIEAGTANPTVLILAALSESLDVHISVLFEDVQEAAEGSGDRLATRQSRTKP